MKQQFTTTTLSYRTCVLLFQEPFHIAPMYYFPSTLTYCTHVLFPQLPCHIAPVCYFSPVTPSYRTCVLFLHVPFHLISHQSIISMYSVILYPCIIFPVTLSHIAPVYYLSSYLAYRIRLLLFQLPWHIHVAPYDITPWYFFPGILSYSTLSYRTRLLFLQVPSHIAPVYYCSRHPVISHPAISHLCIIVAGDIVSGEPL